MWILLICINYPISYFFGSDKEMLDFDMAIVSVPQCCQFALSSGTMVDIVDGFSKDTCSSCGSENEYSLHEMEQQLAIEKVLGAFVFPEELSQSMYLWTIAYTVLSCVFFGTIY